MALTAQVKQNLEKCRASAIAAVEAYNRPGSRFRTAQYLVLIVIAWTAFFHAYFYSISRRPWYTTRSSGKGTGVRYQKIDGDPKHWDLTECLKQYWSGNNPAERRNLEFLLGLRNKIEHRHLPELDASLYGECQAALLNLEDMLVSTFGEKYALGEELAVSLQFSRVIPSEKRRVARVLASDAAKSVTDYVSTFRGGLPSTVLNSMKYSFNVYLVPKVANRESAADVAVQFISMDEASAEELDRMEKLNVLIREKHIPIANLDMFKPSEVVARVKARLPFEFSIHNHTQAWQNLEIRPRKGDLHPERTRPEYCVYDRIHKDYLYTTAWIERLVKDLADPRGFYELIGRHPRRKSAAT